MSGGYTPSVHLFSQSRGKLDWSDALQGLRSRAARPRAERSAGACRGSLRTRAGAWRTARTRAAQALAIGTGRRAIRGRRRWSGGTMPILARCPRRRSSPRPRAFVDWQHDVTTKDLALATREGFQSIEHVKRYTTTGMATDQGKTSNLNAMAIVAQKLDRPIPRVGLTTFRMPYTPVSFGSFAGISRAAICSIRCAPRRRTHGPRRKGAVFENVGLWKRARYFPRARRGHACGGGARVPCGAQRVRHLRCLDAWAKSKWSGRTRPSS